MISTVARFVITALSVVSPVFVIASVWFPVVHRYYVPGTEISPATVEVSRISPGESVLEEISSHKFFARPFIDDLGSQAVVVAKNILHGTIRLPEEPTHQITFPFDPADLVAGSSKWQLAYSSFLIPDILLAAHEQSGDTGFLKAARDYILAWAKYETTSWLPHGFLWNDDAMAARVAVLANFWRLYRNHPLYRPDDATLILELVSQTGRRLAKKQLFTFRTNHGVMQNLGLLQLRLSFPELPGSLEFGQIALDRLRTQLDFYLNGEGVILEHSAGYQKFGLLLLARAFRYMVLLREEIPADWVEKYRKARDYYAMLRRPDGTLPRIGDTGASSRPDGHDPLFTGIDWHGESTSLKSQHKWKPLQSQAIYPAAGYAIWWNGLEQWPAPDGLSQTVIVWANQPGQSHKHADDLSMHLFADGTNWWTAVGYWPYTDPRRHRAISWGGSNAPHLEDESPDSPREVRLLGFDWSESLTAIDLERRGPNGFVVRRQIIFAKPNVWLILDSFHDEEQRATRTIWTTDADVTAHRKGKNSFVLTSADSQSKLLVHFLGSSGLTLSTHHGSDEPLAGWVEQDGKIMPATAFIVGLHSKESWAATISILDQTDEREDQPLVQEWRGPDHWQIAIPIGNQKIIVRRQGSAVLLEPNKMSDKHTKIILDPPVETWITFAKETEHAYAYALQAYGTPPRDLFFYRWRVTYVIMVFLVLQELALGIYRLWRQKNTSILRLLSLVSWPAVGLWLWFIYFPV